MDSSKDRYYVRHPETGAVQWPRRDGLEAAKELARKHIVHTQQPAEVCDQDGRVVFRVSGGRFIPAD